MSISFQLNLTPSQIEFLQSLDLYSDGVIPINDVGRGLNMESRFITHVGKLIREGLVEHVIPGPGEKYNHQDRDGVVIRSYRITEKGRAVLGLVEQDVQAFLSRQRAYQQAKKKQKPA